MKYILFFCGTAEDQRTYEELPEEVRGQFNAQVGQWFAEHGAKITGGNQLQPPQTAKTVRLTKDRRPFVTDGPFIEGNEVIGGYAEIEVADSDEALRLAKSWPAGPVEVRPVVEQ